MAECDRDKALGGLLQNRGSGRGGACEGELGDALVVWFRMALVWQRRVGGEEQFNEV